MEGLQDGQERGERVGLVWVGGDGAFVEKGDAEVEVREGEGCQGFDEDVDDYVRVVEVRVKLVAAQKVSSVHLRTQKEGYRSQFEDGEVGQAVVFLATNLVVQVILEDTHVRRVVPI